MCSSVWLGIGIRTGDRLDWGRTIVNYKDSFSIQILVYLVLVLTGPKPLQIWVNCEGSQKICNVTLYWD